MDSTSSVSIGQRIASMRGFRRLTQEQLGGMVGVTKQTVSGDVLHSRGASPRLLPDRFLVVFGRPNEFHVVAVVG